MHSSEARNMIQFCGEVLQEALVREYAVSVTRPDGKGGRKPKLYAFYSDHARIMRMIRSHSRIGAKRAWYALAFPQYYEGGQMVSERYIDKVMENKGCECIDVVLEEE